ncbi:MAG: HD domain-containing protein [Eubacterium sp.]|nr:HD domain-containing protein [Eubacterium sp.]
MEQFKWSKIEQELRDVLKPGRFRHTMGVTYTACALAMCYGTDMDQARAAGLLHDAAKYIPPKKKLQMCSERNIPVSEAEMQNPELLHAKLGAVVAEEDYGVKDPEVLEAIRCHTTGKPDMSILDKILFISDYIEPNRDKAPHLQEIRRLAFTDPDDCIRKILEDTLSYLSTTSSVIDPMTQQTYDTYLKTV